MKVIVSILLCLLAPAVGVAPILMRSGKTVRSFGHVVARVAESQCASHSVALGEKATSKADLIVTLNEAFGQREAK